MSSEFNSGRETIQDVSLVEAIFKEIHVSQSVLMRQKDKSSNENEQVMRLFQDGQGCNLTLFNHNVLRELDLLNEDMVDPS